MRGLVTLAVLAVCAVGAAEDEPWTVGVEMASSKAKLAQEGVVDDWFSSATSVAVVGTYRGLVENLSISLRLGGADAPLVRKDGADVKEKEFFSDAFLWGLDVAYGGEIGGGDASWEGGLKMENIVGSHADGADEYSLNDFRIGVYGNYVGWTWDTFSVYGGLRLEWVAATFDDRGTDHKFSQPQPFGIVVGFREKAERLSYSMELGFLDSTSLSVGAGLSF